VIEPKSGSAVEVVMPHWDYAAELVLIAATTCEEADIESDSAAGTSATT